MTYNLSPKVEARDWFKINRDLLLGPFALLSLATATILYRTETYSTKFISLDLLWLSAAEASFIYKIRQFLFHELVDLLNGLLEASLGRARDVEVKGRVLHVSSARSPDRTSEQPTAAVAMLLSG